MVLQKLSSMNTPSRISVQNGFTLIEVLVVIAIMALLITVSVQALNTFANRAGKDAPARTVLGALEEAHARTLAADNDTNYGVHFATTTVTIFEGDTYIDGDPTNTVRSLPTRSQISIISLTASTTEVVFSRLRANASATGTITTILTTDPSVTGTVSISAVGLMEITN